MMTQINGRLLKARRGLTLFELLIVLAILAFIATLVAPRVIGYLGRSKHDIATTQASNIASAVELFFLDFGRYPTTSEGLDILLAAPKDEPSWKGPYLKDPNGVVDPWGKRYLYQSNDAGDEFTIESLGRDGEKGGDGDSADVVKKG